MSRLTFSEDSSTRKVIFPTEPESAGIAGQAYKFLRSQKVRACDVAHSFLPKKIIQVPTVRTGTTKTIQKPQAMFP